MAKFPRLTPEEAFVLNPAHTGRYAAEPDSDLSHLEAGARKKARELFGLYERKMLERSRSGFMDFGSQETWGKIAEAMILRLFYNRPVVILAREERPYRMLREVHPLKLVGSPREGRGFHVAKDLIQAVACLVRELTGTARIETRKMRHGINAYCKECGSLLCMSRP